MIFKGMDPVEPGVPTIEVRSGEYGFDLHNAADLVRVTLDLQGRRFEAEWLAENLLASPYYGPYRTARVVLAVSGLSGVSGSARLELAQGDSGGLDYFEHVPGEEGRPGLLRLVFTFDGEICLAGAECELRRLVLE